MNRIITAIILIGLCACNAKREKGAKIIFHIKWANDKKFFLEQVPLRDEKSMIIDSAIAKGDLDSLVFTVPGFAERLFKINAPEVNMSILFITDTPVMDIYANYGNTELYSFNRSPASANLKRFMAKQDSIAASGEKISMLIDSMTAAKKPAAEIDSLHRYFAARLAYFFNQYKNFEDTVGSPAAFMAIYNNVDFGNDNAGLRKFIIKAANRFPAYTPIQELKAETLDLIKIFEEEYNVGDTLPSIVLPDQYGHPFSTATLKGKYYLIDFWSTWCPQCMVYNDGKKELAKKFNSNVFEVVSVAIDAEKDNWQKMIEQQHLNWIQLIDEKMWSGLAVKTLKFDSIPFNFLVSPQGKVIAKAIKPDSLLTVISKNITSPAD